MIPRLSHIGNSNEMALTIDYFPADYPTSAVPHRHDFFEILFFTDGKALHCIDDHDYKISGNYLFLLSEGQVHYFKESQGLSGYLLCFKEYSLQENCNALTHYKTALFNQLSVNTHLKPNASERSEIVFIMQQLQAEAQKDTDRQQFEIISSYLKILLIKIRQLQKGSITDTQKNDYRHEQYLKFLQLLEVHFREKHEAVWYAGQMAISLRTLSNICNLYSGENAKTLISKRILLEARRDLQFTQTPIKNIAVTLHFADQFQFSKFFKKSTSHTPLAYREQFAVIDMH